MIKKKFTFILCIVLSIFLIACGKRADKQKVPLDKDEKEMIELIGEDINTVTDDDYAQTVNELIYHTQEFSGQVYQLEGVYSVDADETYITRTLVNGEEKTVCSLPLKYVQKELEPGAWIRVTGVINQGEIDGEEKTVLEVVAIEALGREGKAELPWDGNFEHQH